MNYLNKLLPFLKCNHLGIISKICLTYTSVILGLFAGILAILLGISTLSDNIILGIRSTSCGIGLIGHYFFMRKGYSNENYKNINLSIIFLSIGFFSYLGLISGAINIAIFGIPLYKSRAYFQKDSNLKINL